MNEFKSIKQHYCPIYSRNIILENTVDKNGDERTECLYQQQGNCNSTDCMNKLLIPPTFSSVKYDTDV